MDPDQTGRASRARGRGAGRAALRVVAAPLPTGRVSTGRVSTGRDQMRRALTVPRHIGAPAARGPLGRVPAAGRVGRAEPADRAVPAMVRRAPAVSGRVGRAPAGSDRMDQGRMLRAPTTAAAPEKARVKLPAPPDASGSPTTRGLPSRPGRAAAPAGPPGSAPAASGRVPAARGPAARGPAASGRVPAARGRATDRARGSNRGTHLARVRE